VTSEIVVFSAAVGRLRTIPCLPPRRSGWIWRLQRGRRGKMGKGEDV